MKAKLQDADFIRIYTESGPDAVAKAGDTDLRGVYRRRRTIEKENNIRLDGPEKSVSNAVTISEHPGRILLDVEDGIVLVGSDAHYWPGPATTAHRAFVQFVKTLKPQVIVMNGDAFDGSSISRFPPIGWTQLPTVQQEIESCQERLHEILSAKTMKCRTIWCLGNHDQRFETRIATAAPEYAKVHGTSLQDHFPTFEPCWSVFINDDHNGVVVKHRFKSGIHAPHNNTMWAGRSMVTGHLHSAKVYPLTDYNGTRYGVDTGCLADADGRQFVDYSEDNPRSWRSGFCVLTFKDGRLLMPELVSVWDEFSVQFRGEIITV
jgi:predicted phosphodiesterase